MTSPNTAELVAIYQHIKAHPEEWRQGWWGRRTQCGTAFCFGGHAAVRAGAKLQWRPSIDADMAAVEAIDFVTTPDGGTELIDEFAARVLGLDDGDADLLFAAFNDLDDIRQLITEFTGVDPESASAVTK